MTLLKIEHIQKYYGHHGNVTKALDDISFEMEEGEFCAVMGASGSGKTTLLNVISTIDTLSAGDIQIQGESICRKREDDLAEFRKKRLGFVFQDFNLLNTLTLEENIALPLTLLKEQDIMEKVQKMADSLGIQAILHKFPYEVSGGQRQRAAIARALIHHPSLILADEPTGALDSHASWQFMEQLCKINDTQNASILMVTHDAFSASYAKRILFLKDGKIFNEIYRGQLERAAFYQKILDVMTLLGGDVHAIR
ncbi:ABC transporter ATP-binding protein [[Eubacterium] hominis]|uniref:ABC transporter ATP-binding protein n=1 Tax=[Eubacterium] hominis TaxID=2764325 RepID=UPI003A4E6510